MPPSARAGEGTTLAALWTSLLFVFAYVDLFSLYRADVRADIARGEIAGFDIGPGFLLGVTLYILPAALMVSLSHVLPPRTARRLHLGLSPLYAISVAVSAVGEGGYYLLASATELILLFAIVRVAWGPSPSPRAD